MRERAGMSPEALGLATAFETQGNAGMDHPVTDMRRGGHLVVASSDRSRSCISQVWSSTWKAVCRIRYGIVNLPSGLPSLYQAPIASTKRSRC
jgi:hypothetical protein